MESRFILREDYGMETTNYGCDITREEFEKHFYPTKEKVTFTFNGWDGKSYDGESRTARVWRSKHTLLEGIRYVKVGKNVHEVYEDSMVEEKSTGIKHPTVGWVITVMRRAK